jgi:hypothetical protein
MSAETMQLLELLREAGEEAVTLDELAVVGVRDPAGALKALEEAGHAVQRVYEHPARGGTVTCVRLASAAAPAASEPPVVVAPAAPPATRAPRRRFRLLTGAALGVLALVVLRALSGRRG